MEARKHCPWAMWFVRVLSPMKRAGATELIITKAIAEVEETGRAVVAAGVRLIFSERGGVMAVGRMQPLRNRSC